MTLKDIFDFSDVATVTSHGDINLFILLSEISVYFHLEISVMSVSKSLKIPKRYSESVYRRRTDNAMAKRKNTKGQTMTYKTYI